MKVVNANLKFKNRLKTLDLNRVKYIVLHHLEAVVATPEQIHQWHLDRGWSGAGYNEYIRKDGTVYILRGDHIGAQTKNHNSISYGIACEGDYDLKDKTMPKKQFEALVERLKYNASRFQNLEKIVGHRELVQTNCPGIYFPIEEILKVYEGKGQDDFEKVLQILVCKNVINTPEYWKAHAGPGMQCDGMYVRTILERIAKIL